MKFSTAEAFSRFVLVLMIFSIGFGFLKQSKTVVYAIGHISAPHEDAGASMRYLRDRLLSLKSHRQLKESQFSYVSDRQNGPVERPVEQFYYDAQYAFAPYSLFYQKSGADFYLLDFKSGEALASYLSENSLQIIAKQRAYVLAMKKEAARR